MGFFSSIAKKIKKAIPKELKSSKQLKKTLGKAIPKELGTFAPVLNVVPGVGPALAAVGSAAGALKDSGALSVKKKSAGPIAQHPAAPSVAGPGQVVPPAGFFEQFVPPPSVLPYLAVGLVVVALAARRRS